MAFSGVYGPVLEHEVDDFLDELDDVRARWGLAWCIGDDFNLMRFSFRRKGDGCRDIKMMKFGNFIDRWNLIDSLLKVQSLHGPIIGKDHIFVVWIDSCIAVTKRIFSLVDLKWCFRDPF